MKVYISGISGTGMGPLALMAQAAGIEVCGSDLTKGAIYDELVKSGIEVAIGPQDGEFLKKQLASGIDWFVYTSALPPDHAELKLAQSSGIKHTKRDDFTAFLIEKLGLKLVAVAGTHGKTTTTSMIIWAAFKLGLPAAYIVGTTLSFAPAGAYHPGDQFFIYEADEYDRNFLKFHPWLAVLPAVSYDHPDIYPTRADYQAAFDQFKSQSQQLIEADKISGQTSYQFKIAGSVRRLDAELALRAIQTMAPELSTRQVVEVLNDFPGAGRRFEKLAEGIYSDYGHHPEEIAAVLDVAKDEAKMRGFSGVTAIYQPHQNTRQHKVRADYRDAFKQVDHLYWLPTYLTREDPSLTLLEPKDFIADLVNSDCAEPAELNDVLFDKIKAARADNQLIILITAGPADIWLREKLAKS